MENEKNRIDKEATILFADLIGSSEVASIKESSKYSDYLKAFQETFLQCYNDVFRGTYYKRNNIKQNDPDPIIYKDIKGDEGFLLLSSDDFSNSATNLRLDISLILKFALLLKIKWLLQNEHSINRIKQKKKPFEIAIGINTGFVKISPKVDYTKVNDPEVNVPEGYAINLTKRIESESRRGKSSGIFISEYTYAKYSDIPGEDILRFVQVGTTLLKGISGEINLYELNFFSIEDAETPEIDPTYLIDLKKEEHKLIYIEDYFKGTLNPWFGNIVCNLKWKQAGNFIQESYKLDKKEKIEELEKASKILNSCIKLSRKLIECDPENGIWKIYLAQIIYDYLSEIKRMNKDDRELLIDETTNILEDLTKKYPEDLDARLYQGKYYLLQSNKTKDEIINHFKKITLWKDEYYDAYYYLAAAYLLNPENESEALRQLKKCYDYINDTLGEEYSEKMITDAYDTDKLFKNFKTTIKKNFPKIIRNK